MTPALGLTVFIPTRPTTVIRCSWLFEVTSVGEVVWEYVFRTKRFGRNNTVRAYRYAPDFPGLRGNLVPRGVRLDESSLCRAMRGAALPTLPAICRMDAANRRDRK